MIEWEGDPYVIREWTDAADRRLIEFSIDRPVFPAVRQTQRGKYVVTRAREYNDWANGTRDQLLLIMRREGIEPFGSRRGLNLTATIRLAPRAVDVGVGVDGHVRLIHPAKTSDLNNLVKAVEDAMQGALYKNDRQIRAYGNITVEEGSQDRLWCRIREIA